MEDKKTVVGLDVGTTKVCTVVATTTSTGPELSPEIIGVGTYPSYGLKKGQVVDIEKTVSSVQKSLEEAQLMAGVPIEEASVGIAGGHIYSFNSSGVVAIKKNTIDRSDVERVLEAAQAVVIPKDREILHVASQEFRVDNTRNIRNPIGMCGIRLEALVHVVTGAMSPIKNLIRCIERTGIRATNVTLQPIASSHAVLTPEEREVGVVLVDIGGGTTDMAVWKNASLIHSQIIPVGGDHFTGDLAVALKTPYGEAERIKIEHGRVLKGSETQGAHVMVEGIPGSTPREVGLGLIADVLGARAEELLEMIKNIVTERSLSSDIIGGVVLTGGGALIKGLDVLGEYIIELPTKVGYPLSFGGMANVMQSPKFSTVLGLLIKSKNAIPSTKERSLSHRSDIIGKLSGPFRSAFKEIF